MNDQIPRSRSANKNSDYRQDPQLMAAGIVSWHLTMLPHAWRPPTDLFETDDKFVVRVEISGMRDGQFSVSVDNNVLTISGIRPDTNERRAFHQMEIHFGDFSTELELPANIDVHQIVADYEDGFLWVHLPKAQPKHISIGD